MKRKISDMLDAYSGAELNTETQTPLSSERIRELTMSKIENKKNKPRRTAFRMLAAAAMIAALAGSVVAAGTGAEWFINFFGNRSEAKMSDEQIEFIDGNTVEEKQSQPVNGYTVTLQSYISDGRNSYFRLNVLAPEGKELPKIIFDHRLYKDGDWVWGYASQWSQLEVNQKAGTGCYLLTLKDVPVEMDGLELRLTDMEYYDEVGRMLVAGIWSFDLDVPDTREIELVRSPLTGIKALTEQGESFEITVTSAKLRAMGLKVVYDAPSQYLYGNHEFDEVKAILFDGSYVGLHWDGSTFRNDSEEIYQQIDFGMDTPLDLDAVAYIEFPGGVLIPVNES